jgi:hypothetical protein
MDGLGLLVLIVAGLALFGLLATRVGVDTTATSDPRVPANNWS